MMSLLLLFLTIGPVTEACPRADPDRYLAEYRTLESSVEELTNQTNQLTQENNELRSNLTELASEMNQLRLENEEVNTQLQVLVLIGLSSLLRKSYDDR